MSLREAFIILVPEVDPRVNRTEIVLANYEFYTILVSNFEMAKVEAKKIVKEKDIHGVILCAGFSNENVGDMSRELGDSVGTLVVRGDSRSNGIIDKAINDSKW